MKRRLARLMTTTRLWPLGWLMGRIMQMTSEFSSIFGVISPSVEATGSSVFAEARGVRNGDRVRVFNSRGEIVLRAQVDGSVASGVVAARLDWARFSPGGTNVNVLTSEKLSDLGNAATFYSVCVEVELFGA